MNQTVNIKLLYKQEQFPIFQNRMYDTEKEAKACATGNIELVENQSTGLVYNAAFCPERMIYDAHYQNEQAISPLFRQHLESVLGIVDRCMGRSALVEVGCGKGFFLEVLLGKGFDITGFDPTYEGNNSRVMRYYFEPGVGMRANGLVLRHVLEHVQHPYDFLLQLKLANGGSGRIYIEVPCFDWICERKSWFDVFYEHVNYFRISDFFRMFGKVVESGRLFGDQYLYVVAELDTLKEPKLDTDDVVVFPKNFLASLNEPGLAESVQSAIWGGASKGVIFALLKDRVGQPVKTVIDINPAKQGKYLPSTGLLVQSPADALSRLPKGSTIYVMNSNYLEEIKEMSGNAYRYVEIDHV
jgi:hypothetical protein